jgi:hypothetical protein
MSYTLEIMEKVYSDKNVRYLYHRSNDPDLHKKGIGVKSGSLGRSYKRSWFTSHDKNWSTYKHIYKIDTKHPNLSKHVFHREDIPGVGTKQHPDSYVTNKDIPSGPHLKKIK